MLPGQKFSDLPMTRKTIYWGTLTQEVLSDFTTSRFTFRLATLHARCTMVKQQEEGEINKALKRGKNRLWMSSPGKNSGNAARA